MSNELALWLSIGAGALAVLFGVISTQWILKQPAGNERMQTIAAGWGYITSGDDPAAWNADHVLASPDELAQLLTKALG